MMSLQRPKRLLYPVELVDRNVMRLKRDLRRLYRKYRRGVVNRLECVVDGEALVRAAFLLQQADVRAYVAKHGLPFSGDFSELEGSLAEILARWRRVVEGFSEAAACTCTEHRILAAKGEEYWNSFAGITRRIDGLAQDLHFVTVNGAVRMIGVAVGVKWMHFVTAGDDRVCPVCLRFAQGGRGGYYKTNWFMPKIPCHFGDRCLWELVLYDPFGED